MKKKPPNFLLLDGLFFYLHKIMVEMVVFGISPKNRWSIKKVKQIM